MLGGWTDRQDDPQVHADDARPDPRRMLEWCESQFLSLLSLSLLNSRKRWRRFAEFQPCTTYTISKTTFNSMIQSIPERLVMWLFVIIFFLSLCYIKWNECNCCQDGTKVFMASCDKMVKCWDLASNQTVQVAAHDAPIKTCHFVKGQSYSCIMTGSWDKTLKVWCWNSSLESVVSNLGITNSSRQQTTSLGYRG